MVHLQAHDITKSSLPDAFFGGLEQIARFPLLNFYLGIAGNMKRIRLENGHPREELIEIGANQIFEPDVGIGLGLDDRRSTTLGSFNLADGHKLRQTVRYFDASKAFFTVGIADQNGQVEG
jgi:hypothetical protein